jgi:L-ascorbate metabolism protein UlaG (beta-lactamase superfamily)
LSFREKSQMFIIIIIPVVLFIFMYIKIQKEKTYYNANPDEFFNGKTFKNIGKQRPEEEKITLKFAYNFFFNKPKWTEEVDVIQVIPNQQVPKENIRAYFINHSTILIQTNGLNIITDPVFANKVGPLGIFGPKRHHVPGIDINKLPKIDIILLSHSHYDHMDLKSLGIILKSSNPLIITPVGNDYILKNFNKKFLVKTLTWGESININNTKITLEKAYHWSKRTPWDSNKALWGSFVIQTPTQKIFFAGDTALDDGAIFKAIGKKYGYFTLALLPIGAYEPNDFMKYAHTNPHEATLIHKMINSYKSIGIHWGTFQLSFEGYYQPKEDLETAKKDLNIPANQFITLKPGEFIDIKYKPSTTE